MSFSPFFKFSQNFRWKNKKNMFFSILSGPKNVAVYDAIIRFYPSTLVDEIFSSKWNIKIKQKKLYIFEFPLFAKNAQYLQIDKIYHRKEQEISYKEVHLVNFGRTFPGKPFFGLNSTVLVGTTIVVEPKTREVTTRHC